MNPALWIRKKLTTVPYLVNQKQVIDLRKYEQEGVFDRIIVKLTGSLATGSATGGSATGLTNPEDLLVNCTLKVTPSAGGLLPFNQVSGRTLKYDRALEDRCIRNAPVITDAGGAETLDVEYHLVFKRKGARKGIEYSFDIGRYTGAFLELTFGDQTRLFSGSSNTWSFASVNVEVWGIINYTVNPNAYHAFELFENNYPILTAQADFPITDLPDGALYTDLCLLTEFDNALSNAVLNNIDLEGGGRSWLPAGDSNADFIQRVLTRSHFDGSVFQSDDPAKYSGANVTTGIYSAVRMLDGMWSRAVDALTTRIFFKLNVNAPGSGHTENVRLFGRKLIPGGVYKAEIPAPARK